MAHAASTLATLPPSQPVIIDGLALGAFSPEVLSGVNAPVIALIHHPLALEEGLSDQRKHHLFHQERANLHRVQHVIVPSAETASRLITDYGISPGTITVVQPGLNLRVEPGTRREPPLILSVGIHVPRKGHDVLVEALAQITDLSWEAVVVGQERDLAYSKGLQQLCEERGVSDRVVFAGFVSDDELATLYSQATVFALATRFEGYGMVFDEAKAAGLPIVTCDTGAVSQTVPATAGILVPPGDPEAFAEALRVVLTDESRRVAMAEGSLRAGRDLPSWTGAATTVASIVEAIVSSEENEQSDGNKR